MAAIITLLSRLFVTRDKRPPYRKLPVAPVWTVGSVNAQSLAANGGVLLAVTNQAKLIALDGASGKQCWIADFAVERVAACGLRTAIVMATGESRPHLVELDSGRHAAFDDAWQAHEWHAGNFYGFTGRGEAIAMNEEGLELSCSDTEHYFAAIRGTPSGASR